ncbi:MAG TPA: DUF402 domain-containing protein [Nocardioidaceae bacterium]|nr:DUF402 domain-containing protein [Nocardioidaceae bacterium]
MSHQRMAFTKWGGLPHWEYDAVHLGEDLHGTWLGVPRGTAMSRPGATLRTDQHQVLLVPDAGFVASYFAPGGRSPCDLYVDITTVAEITDRRISAVDLDLDVVRGWTGRIWVDDEDEFAVHRTSFGYPDDVVEHATRTCAEVRRDVEQALAPFDPVTATRWLSLVDEAMMAR